MKENLVEIIFIHMLSIMIQLIEIWIRFKLKHICKLVMVEGDILFGPYLKLPT